MHWIPFSFSIALYEIHNSCNVSATASCAIHMHTCTQFYLFHVYNYRLLLLLKTYQPTEDLYVIPS